MDKPRTIIVAYILCLTIPGMGQNVDRKAMLVYEPLLDVPTVNEKQAKAGFKNVISTAGLNVLFARQLAQYLSSSTDLSYNKGYAVLDDEDDRLYVGYTTNHTKDFGAFIRNLTSIGVKSNVSDGFSTLWKESTAQPDIGLAVKHSFILGGTLKTGRIEKNIESVKRRNAYVDFLLNKARMDMGKWADAEDAAAKNAPDPSETSKILADRTESKSAEKGQDLVKAEVDYILDHELFTVATNSWLTLELYVPFTQSEYLTADSITNTSITTHTLRPYEGRLNLSRYWQAAAGQALFLQVGALAQQFNTVLDKSVEAVPFEEWQNRGGGDTLLVAQLASEDVYVGPYKDFMAWAVTARGAYLFPICGSTNRMGFSASIEKYFSENYNPLNWKLGIPFSLMDKDDEPAVNFEIQWREQNETHSIGISVGLPIGQFVYE